MRRPSKTDDCRTVAELYLFRMLYNALLFNEWAAAGRYGVYKSLRHDSGELCFGGGWFVVSALLPAGQITNHYAIEHWHRFRIPVRDKAIAWDGHTSQDAAERLAALLDAHD